MKVYECERESGRVQQSQIGLPENEAENFKYGGNNYIRKYTKKHSKEWIGMLKYSSYCRWSFRHNECTTSICGNNGEYQTVFVSTIIVQKVLTNSWSIMTSSCLTGKYLL